MSETESETNSMSDARTAALGGDSDLLRRTLRMTGALVAACILFVGALSLIAVLVTSKAVGAGAKASADGDKTTDTATAKKPLSI